MSEAFENLLTAGVLIGIFIIAYLRITNQTLLDLFKEIKEMMTPDTESYKI